MGSALVKHDDPGECCAGYSEGRDDAVVCSCQSITFPFSEGNDYSLAPIIRNMLC